MSNKYLHYAELSENHGKHIVSGAENWTDMLTTAARLYKYSFDEQLLIHAQKPDATACAELPVWNNPVGRYVKKGTKGIALLDDSGGKQRLRYIFDIADTAEGRYNPKTPYIWQMKPEHEALVAETFGRTLDEIPTLAAELAANYFDENIGDIQQAFEESGFTDYEAFYATLSDSAAYMIMSRCGLDISEFTNGEKFDGIGSFGDTRILKALGEGISTISENVLRDIEIVIKNHDKEQARLARQNERSDIHDSEHSQNELNTGRDNLQLGGGLSDTRHRDTGGRGQSAVIDQMGNDAEGLLEETPQDNLHGLETGGQTVSPLLRNRGTGERPAGIDDEAVIGIEPGIGGLEENRPDGLGGANERLESASGGSYQNRIDLRIDQPTEIPSARDTARTGGIFMSSSIDPAMSTVTDEEINECLKSGSGTADGKFRIFSYFLQEDDTAERTRFLRNEYGTGGRSNAFPNVDRSYEDHDGRGMIFKKGNLLEPSATVNLSWTNIAGRIDRLIKNGDYMTQSELDRLPTYERQILGAGVMRFYDYNDTETLPPIPMLRSGDFWGEAQRIGDLLDNPETRSALLMSMTAIMEETSADHRSYDSRRETLANLTAFDNGKFTLFPNYELAAQPSFINEIAEQAEETIDTAKIINAPIREPVNNRPFRKNIDDEQLTLFSMFPAEETQISSIKETEEAEIAAIPVTITQEDIDNAIIAWNGNSASKRRVYEYTANDESSRALDNSEFFKREFGGELDRFTVNKNGAAPVVVPWDKIQQRISILAEEGQFLTPQDWDYIHEQRRIELQSVVSQDQPERSGGLPITRAIAEQFRNPNDPRNDLLYAKDENGGLFISNRYFIIKTEEQDIGKVTEQLNLYRNADRRKKELPPLVAVENAVVLETLNNADNLRQLDQSRNFVFKPYSDSTTENIVLTDGAQYFVYNKDFVDMFGAGDSVQYNIQNADVYDFRKHNLVMTDANDATVGLILPMMTNERMYQNLADTFPLDVPYKTELARIKENPTNDPYIGREFFDGRDNYIVASLELNHISGTNDEPDSRYILREIRKDGTLSNGGIYVKVDEMEERIALWESNREAAEAVRAQAELRAQAEAKAKEIYENTHGFADNLPQLQKARVLDTLDKGFITKEYGNLTTKAFIENAIQNGCTVKSEDILKKKYQTGEYGLHDYLSEYVHNNYENAKTRKAFVSVTQDGNANSENAQFLKDNHPFLHYLAFNDQSVLPDSFFSTEYHLVTGQTENGGDIFYSINKTTHDYGKYLVDNKVFAEPEPVIDMSVREKAISDTAPKIPLDRITDIILYQIGDTYEAYGVHADMLASQLPLILIENADEPLLNYVSFPADKLQEYTDKFHENSNRNFTISTELLDGTRDITHITHPFWDLSEWEQYVHVVSQDESGSYTEPFVVIENSESPNFADYEWLTFTEADQKFKDVEAEKGVGGGYHKTNGVIFYKTDPADTELSTYEFRYDIGDYQGERSGLYNHINNYWNRVDDALNGLSGESGLTVESVKALGYTQESIDSVKSMLAVLNDTIQPTAERLTVENETVEPQIPEIPVTPKNEIPVYKDTLQTANNNGEREAFIASRELNYECGRAIEAAISANTTSGPMAGTQYVDAKTAAESVIAEYGAERVAWVLACEVNYSAWDGRLSNTNKEWARGFDTPESGIYHFNAHKTIVDSFVTKFREIEQELAQQITPPVADAEQPQESRYQGSPLWQDYQFVKDQYPDRVLFYKLGDFYEVMGRDTQAIAETLNVTLTSRDVGLKERIPLIGIPQHRLDECVETLTNAGFGVAIRRGQDDIETRSRNIWSGEQTQPPQKDYELGYGPDENGVSVWNQFDLTDDNGQEKFIAHINHDREIIYTAENLPADVKNDIEIIAKGDWKEMFAIEMAGMDYNPKPYSEQAQTNRTSSHNGTELNAETETHTPEEIQEILYGIVEKARSGNFYYTDVENAALALNLTLAEYGDQNPENHYGAEAYAFWNADGDRYADDAIRVDYNFNEDGNAGKAENIEIDFTAFGIEPPQPTLVEQEHEARVQAVTQANTDRFRDTWADVLNNTASADRVNFRITDPHLGEGGAKVKYGYNIEAIKTLQAIESENRLATPEEQAVLSRYVGWGGLQEAFDDKKPGWAREYQELKGLLSPEEYDAARASVLNAHYTSPTVISAMYEALERMGVKGGNILEPAMGVGNFFGLIPESMRDAKLYGVELDSITGRIAKQLYQQADIKVMGFEKTKMPDSFFDVAVGNVPFGGFGVVDKKYDKHHFMIHDYFFARALDQVRPGGIVAFVTSKGTMDKTNPAVRKYLAQRADLLGAVRLPNDAFLKNAGTEVTSDIIFLQKRESLRDIEPPWVHLGQTANGITVNSYFAENPHMILGTMSVDSGARMYGNENSTTCIPIEGADLSQQLREALFNIQGQITEIDTGLVINDDGAIDLLDLDDSKVRTALPADPSVKNFSYTIVDDTVYFRENSIMRPVDMPAATLERVKGMVGLRDAAKELIDLQLYDGSDFEIASKQAELNSLYDDFTRKNGLINASANARAFNEDSSYYLLASLEVLDENGALERKSDIFTKRTIKQEQEITSVDTSAEALAVSISRMARVDMDYMAELTGFTEEKIAADLHGVIFKDFGGESGKGGAVYASTMLQKFCMSAENEYEGYKQFLESRPYVTADEYLSGNVREKLEFAKNLNHTLLQRAAEVSADSGRDWASLSPQLAPNITALEEAQPKALDASEIAVRLGSTWVDKAYYQQFAYELLETPYYQKNSIKVEYSEHTGEWNISGKTVPSYNDVLVNTTYGTERANAYTILESSLNLRDIRIYDTKFEDGKETRVLNKKETTLALQKQDALKEAFKEWVFKDPDRRQALVAKYNRLFNSTRTRQYDGSHIEFAGASPDISLRPHQRGAIARILYGGNTLLAHEVGAGKSFEMVGAAMESKRLGLCNKSMMVVPNHIIEDMASEFMRLYPSANILVASKKDFEPKNRKKFCARIATGDYDCVIIGHSQFEKIPLSAERQERLLQDQITELALGIAQIKESRGERFTIKQMEKSKKNLEVRLAKLTDDSRKDDVVTFEQLGVDRLFVDEAHNYKNLFLVTKMRNVAGLSTSEAQKSSDLFMKCRYLDELTGGKGVVFATGTPISNSLAEMYTMQRYLQYDTLQNKGLGHFDNWASTFGETVTAVELAPEGSGYRARTRFAKFQNLPELMTMFGDVADIKTADTLNLPRPKANYHVIVAEPTELQREMVAALSERATAVQRKEVDPSQDNMLCITSDGRKIGLDQRMMNPLAPDEPGSKVNLCAKNVFKIWEETAENRSTQLIFCDFSTPNKDGRFNVYDDIKTKLLYNGVPESEIAFIHDYNTEAQKKELFAKVRSGKVRVLLGSTAKCGSGTNIQDRLIALHDLDCPWRPADLAQRAGRIERQGNQNPEVDIFRYVTDATFDSYLFQTVQKKQEFISQIMTSKSPVRTCDDMDEQALSYAEIKALCAGNPLIAEKMGLDVEVAKLKMLKANHQSQQYRLEDNLRLNFPKQIESTKAAIEGYKADLSRLEANTVKVTEGISPMTIGASTFGERKDAGAALIEACRGIQGVGPDKVGSYRGFEVSISFDTFYKEYKCHLKGAITHTVPLGSDPAGNIIRIDNALDKISVTLATVEAKLETLYSQVENAKVELTKPFPQEAELTQKSARLAELDSLLSLDGKDEPTADAPAAEAPVSDADIDADGETKPALRIPQAITPVKDGAAAVIPKAEVRKDEAAPAQPPKKISHDAR